MDALIVVPARYGSTRFPQKPLHPIAGRLMVERTADVAARAAEGLEGVAHVVATDHEAIQHACAERAIPVVMTPADAPSGSDRALAAVRALGVSPRVVVNLQGDAPLTPPGHVRALLDASRAVASDVWTPVERLSWAALDDLRARKRETPFSGTTCVADASGRALWFSKVIIPGLRKEAALREAAGGDRHAPSPVLRHVGLYAYTLTALERFASLPESPMERLEGLEQLRFLENGMGVHTVAVEPAAVAMSGVDTPQDAALAEELIARHGDPFGRPFHPSAQEEARA